MLRVGGLLRGFGVFIIEIVKCLTPNKFYRAVLLRGLYWVTYLENTIICICLSGRNTLLKVNCFHVGFHETDQKTTDRGENKQKKKTAKICSFFLVLFNTDTKGFAVTQYNIFFNNQWCLKVNTASRG